MCDFLPCLVICVMSPGATTLLVSTSTVLFGCSHPCWLSVAADPFHRIIGVAHGLLFQVRTAWRCGQPEVSDGTKLCAFCLVPGVRGALQAKYWKAASPGPISDVFSVCCALVHCVAGASCEAYGGMAVLCDPRELDRAAGKRTDFVLPCMVLVRSAPKRHSSQAWQR